MSLIKTYNFRALDYDQKPTKVDETGEWTLNRSEEGRNPQDLCHDLCHDEVRRHFDIPFTAKRLTAQLHTVPAMHRVEIRPYSVLGDFEQFLVKGKAISSYICVDGVDTYVYAGIAAKLYQHMKENGGVVYAELYWS